MPGGRKHYTKLPGYHKPTRADVTKAKHGLNIPPTEKLPRCMARSKGKVYNFERDGDFSHSEKGHVCDACRCNYKAGFGTDHLGMGYCIVHENSDEYKSRAPQIAEAHKVAIRQGYPDRAYVYAQSDPKGYIAKIRADAAEAGGMTSLREEMLQIRYQTQKILESFEDPDTFKVRVKKVTTEYDNGKVISKKEKFIMVPADDKEKTDRLVKLMSVLSKMSVDNLKLTEDDVVTHGQVKIWAAATVALVQRMSPNQEFVNEFVGEFAKLLNNVRTGRK